MMKLGTLCIIFTLFAAVLSQSGNYTVTLERLNDDEPVLTEQDGQSTFMYNYNPSFFAQDYNDSPYHLLVRVQDPSPPGSQFPLTPSQLAYSTFENYTTDPLRLGNVSQATVVFNQTEPWENYATEDPRVVYVRDENTYYMMYSAVEFADNKVTSRLAVASSIDPTTYGTWKKYGPVFPDLAWSKSGAILLNEQPPHYMIFGDSTLIPGVQLAQSDNLVNWTLVNDGEILIHTRNNSWDSHLIEAGPPPLHLSDGNWFFIYNAAHNDPNNTVNGLLYNAGWVILDKDDPSHIIQRSEHPLIYPELDWETGTPPALNLTPQVVFVEAMYYPDGEANRKNPEYTDVFNIYYGGADSVVGCARVTVNVPSY